MSDFALELGELTKHARNKSRLCSFHKAKVIPFKTYLFT